MRSLLALLGFAQPIGVWIVAQTTDGPVSNPWTQLGAFAAAAAVGAWFARDLIMQRNFERQQSKSYADQIIPVMTEVRDALRANTDALRAGAETSKAMVEALGKVPTDAETIRLLRDALALRQQGG